MDTDALADHVVFVVASYLMRLAAGVPHQSGDAHAASLYRLIAGRLQSSGNGDEMKKFKENPRDAGERAVVRYLVRHHLEQNPGFRSVLFDAAKVLPSEQADNPRAGVGARPQSSPRYGHNPTTPATDDFWKTGGAKTVAAIVLVVLLIIAKLISWGPGGIWSSSLTADSTCREYLASSPQERDAAVKDIGVQLHDSEAGSPLRVINTEYMCGQAPDMKLGAVLRDSQ
ncbi:hypothetical protein AAH991_38510 [Microbispora sp. ZYX-F-249]|uniref:DUF732 domain-containing protein n=1 Tax=Microbispora maris TaxID=3144104 RepID=A0ABV0B0K9_9ACTN